MPTRQRLARAAATVIGVVLLQVLAGGLLETLNREWYDALLRWRALRQPADDAPYVLVEIDDASIEVLGRFPWGRQAYADLLDRTTEGGARVVGFDVLLSEAADPSGDSLFADAIQRAGNVVLGSSAALSKPGEAPPGEGSVGRLRSAERLLEPLPRFAQGAAGVGSLSVLEDDDGALRRYPVLVRYQGEPYPSLAQVMAALSEFDADLAVPLARDGSLLINWGELSPAAVGRISFVDALGLSRADALRVFSDKLVLVAATYEGGVDVALTPLAPRTPASFAHLYALHGLRTGRTITDVTAFTAVVLSLIVLFILVTQVPGHTPARVWGTTGLVLVLLLLGSAVFLVWGRIALEPALPTLATLVFLGLYALHQWQENATARQRAEEFLERFLGARIRRRGLDETNLPARAHETPLAILSLRIPNISSAAAGATPEDAVELLRALHLDLAGIVEASEGTIDRLLPDGLVAYWGYPESQDDGPVRAVTAAQEIRSAIYGTNDRLSTDLSDRLRFRIGIATGPAIIADVGSEGLADFTLTGRFAGLASRLRDTAPADGIHICAWTHDAARSALPGAPFDQPPIEVDGFTQSVPSYLLERPYRAWVHRDDRAGESAI